MMFGKLYKAIWGYLLFSSLLFTACGDNNTPNNSQANSIKIGFLGPFTGSLEGEGKSIHYAVEMAAAEINAAGGVLGKKIQILAKDSGTAATKVSAPTKELLAEGVAAIIGPATSSEAMVVLDEVRASRTPIVSYSTTAIDLASENNKGLFWRTILSDEYQAKVLADYAIDDLKKKNAGVIYIDNTYGNGLAKTFKQHYENRGGQVLQMVPYMELEDKDLESYSFADETQKVFKDKPDIIVMISYYKDGAKITVQAKQYIDSAYKPIFLGCDGNYGSQFFNSADPEVILGMLGTMPISPEMEPNYQTFAEAYKQRYSGEKPEGTAVGGYDAMYLIAYAIAKGGMATPESISANLQAVSGPPGEKINVGQFAQGIAVLQSSGDIDYEGGHGAINWDDFGNVTAGTYKIWEVVKGSNGLESTQKEIKYISNSSSSTR